MAREMKDSGIEWIGEMPAEWNVIAFWQAILRMGTGLNPRDNFQLTKTDPLYYVTIRNFKDGHLFLDDSCDRISKDAWEVIQERSDLQKGDILFASISKDGQAYILESDPVNWNINESVFCIRVNPEYFTEKYFYYHLINAGYYEDLRMDATGSTFQSIKQNKLRKSRMVLPPLSEQKRISDFLDRKCSEIDSVIADTQHTIEEYKKLKQSIITEAVTKGVRGKRPLKDSEIEWVGAIPVEWNIMVAFQIFKQVKEKNEGLVEQNLLSLSYGKIKRKSIDTVGGLLPENFDGYNIIEANDIVLRLTDLQNDHNSLRVGLSNERGIVTSAYVTLRNHSQNNPLYLYYYLHAFDICKGFYGMGAGVRQGLNWDGIKMLKFVIPPVDEQQEITAYLETKCAEIDRLIVSKQQLLEEMESYKKSVIYEYVTGKKEVPACQ